MRVCACVYICDLSLHARKNLHYHLSCSAKHTHTHTHGSRASRETEVIQNIMGSLGLVFPIWCHRPLKGSFRTQGGVTWAIQEKRERREED